MNKDYLKLRRCNSQISNINETNITSHNFVIAPHTENCYLGQFVMCKKAKLMLSTTNNLDFYKKEKKEHFLWCCAVLF